MSPVVIDLQQTDDQRDVIHRAVQALAEGNVVALPTETVYGLAASALNADAVRRLIEVKARPPENPLTLAVKSVDDALDYVPSVSNLGRRVMRRSWPGPITLVMDCDHPDSLSRQLPDAVRDVVCPRGTLGLRVPAHQVVLSILRLSAGPLVLTSANPSGQPDATTAAMVVDYLGGRVPLVLDGGPSQYGQPSSVIQVAGNSLRVLRGGLVNSASLQRLASYVVLLVCTGNTCRSPMAEALFRHHLAARLGVGIDELVGRGVSIVSAGLAAANGGAASAEAVAVMEARGLDIRGHESQPITDRLVQFADLILTMTRSHRDAILSHWPAAADRVQLLCGDGGDVSDPIGGPPELYARCAEQIETQVKQWVDSLDLAENIVRCDQEESGE